MLRSGFHLLLLGSMGRLCHIEFLLFSIVPQGCFAVCEYLKIQGIYTFGSGDACFSVNWLIIDLSNGLSSIWYQAINRRNKLLIRYKFWLKKNKKNITFPSENSFENVTCHMWAILFGLFAWTVCAEESFWWLSARLQWLQCVSNGVTAVLHYAIDLIASTLRWVSARKI